MARAREDRRLARSDVDPVEDDPGRAQRRQHATGQVLRPDRGPHDLVFADKTLPGIGTTSSGNPKSTTLTFRTAGTFTFECTIHPGMAGKIVVS